MPPPPAAMASMLICTTRRSGEEALQFTSGGLVGLGVTELGCDDRPPIAYVEVDISGCEIVRFEVGPDRDRRLEDHHFQLPSLCVGRVLENLEVTCGHVVVERLRVCVEACDHDTWACETGVEVRVAVRDVLAGDSR